MSRKGLNITQRWIQLLLGLCFFPFGREDKSAFICIKNSSILLDEYLKIVTVILWKSKCVYKIAKRVNWVDYLADVYQLKIYRLLLCDARSQALKTHSPDSFYWIC